jgi:hypothetical protein
MSPERANDPDPRVQHALSELRQLIQSRYPGATFTTFRGEDPVGMYLRATVDVEDTDEVVDVFIDRLVGLQVEEQLPIYVVTSRPVERVAGEMRSARPSHRHRALRRASLNP